MVRTYIFYNAIYTWCRLIHRAKIKRHSSLTHIADVVSGLTFVHYSSNRLPGRVFGVPCPWRRPVTEPCALRPCSASLLAAAAAAVADPHPLHHHHHHHHPPPPPRASPCLAPHSRCRSPPLGCCPPKWEKPWMSDGVGGGVCVMMLARPLHLLRPPVAHAVWAEQRVDSVDTPRRPLQIAYRGFIGFVQQVYKYNRKLSGK